MTDNLLAAVRAYWDAQPCNLRHSCASVGSRSYFDAVRTRKFFVEPHLPPFAAFSRWREKRVLDLGCGIGTVACRFAQAGALVTAVDLSPVSVALAQLQATVYGVADRMTCREANIERLADAVAPQPYDLLWSWGVLHHTPHPLTALVAWQRFAHPGTELRVMLYHRHSTKALGTALRHGWPVIPFDRAVARQSEAQTGCPVTRTYTVHTARVLLVAAGWTVTAVQVAHIFPYRVGPYQEYRYARAFPWNILPPALFRWLERRMGWHLLLTARRDYGER